MTIENAKQLLLDKDYKQEAHPIMPNEEQYYKRISGSDCNLNGRPPPIVITFNTFQDQISMKIGLRAETASGDWCDIGWYAMNIDRLDSLSEHEYLIEKMWETLN